MIHVVARKNIVCDDVFSKETPSVIPSVAPPSQTEPALVWIAGICRYRHSHQKSSRPQGGCFFVVIG